MFESQIIIKELMETKEVITVKPIEKDSKVIGIEIPVINKQLLFEDISKEGMNWYDAIEYAEKKGKRIPTLRELYILAYFKDEICKYFSEWRHLWIWSSAQTSAGNAWGLNDNGYLNYTGKYYKFCAVPLSDLNTEDCSTENSENHQTK